MYHKARARQRSRATDVLASHPAHFEVGETSGLRDAAAPCATKGPGRRLAQRNTVAGRDEDRLYSLSGAQHRADMFLTDTERNSSAPAVWDGSVAADQKALGAPEGGNIEQET